jgi:GMP synthase-like glutamine amidotransferase
MKLLIIKNGLCETDIAQLIFEADQTFETDTVCSRANDYDSIDIQNYCGVIILGGVQRLSDPDSYNRYPYLADLVTNLRNWIDRGVNVLGICLGAQLIALALGHEVVECRDMISGYDKQIKLTTSGQSDPIFDYDFDMFRSYYLALHCDRISLRDTGERVNILAEMDEIPYVIRYRNTYGVQFHPDITLRILRTFCSEFNFDPGLIEEGTKISNCLKMASIVFFMHWVLTIRSNCPSDCPSDYSSDDDQNVDAV